MLNDCDLQKSFWPYAIKYASLLNNRLPSFISTHNGKSPLEIALNETPDFSKYFRFGSVCYAHKLSTKLKRSEKFDDRATKCYFIGIPDGKPGRNNRQHPGEDHRCPRRQPGDHCGIPPPEKTNQDHPVRRRSVRAVTFL